MSNKNQFAFIKAGSFSKINKNLLKALQNEFQTHRIDVIDIWDDIIERKELINLFYVVKEYGFDLLRGHKRYYECISRTTYFFNKVRKRLKERLADNNYLFTFQTQSLFDASLEDRPHFVYTDHTHLNNLTYPIFDEKQLFNDSWIELEKTIYQNASLNFTMSSNVRDSIIEQYDCPADKVKTVYAGCNSAIPKDQPINIQKYSNKNILFVGVDWERKGGPELVEAFKYLLDIYPDVQLTIVGCSPDISIPNCRIIGKVPISEVNQYYENASVFCLPTKIEPFGIVFIEAFMYRLPVVSSKIGALPEIVKDGESGYLVDYNNANELKEKLKMLVSNPDQCKTFGAKGYEHVKNRYTWENTAINIRQKIDQFI